MNKVNRRFVEALFEYRSLVGNDNPFIVRRTNALNSMVTVFVLAPTAPDSLVLPTDCLWINSDQASPDYKKVYYRQSENIWMPFDGLVENFWYLPEYSEQNSLDTNLKQADIETLGTVRLSVEPESAEDPVVLTDSDISLANDRDPLEHDNMHPEIPASLIKTQAGTLGVHRSLFSQYKFMTVVSNSDAYWSFASLPVPGSSILPTPDIYNRDQVKDVGGYDGQHVTNVEVYLV